VLAAPALNVVSTPLGDVVLQRIADAMTDPVFVDDLTGLGGVLDRELGVGPRSLALIGHSTPLDRVLCLGETELSACPVVIEFFARRRDQLAALEIGAIHLLGCCTAVRPRGQAAMRAIADAAGVPVLGSITILSVTAYDRAGLRADYAAAYLVDADHAPVDGLCLLDPITSP
jgi:hypothetical protein